MIKKGTDKLINKIPRKIDKPKQKWKYKVAFSREIHSRHGYL